jgi:hypothetical protein
MPTARDRHRETAGSRSVVNKKTEAGRAAHVNIRERYATTLRLCVKKSGPRA